MKTACPDCRTVFRITSGELRARSGQVRCGRCRTVFNAFDELSDDAAPLLPPTASTAPLGQDPSPAALTSDLAASDAAGLAGEPDGGWLPGSPAPEVADRAAQAAAERSTDILTTAATATPPAPLSSPGESDQESKKHWLGDARRPARSAASQRWEKLLLGMLVGLFSVLLAAQLIFQLRTTISLAVPGLQPWLSALCELIGSELPLPQRSDLLTIEASDLQSEPGRAALLTLQMTVRNQANHAQAYPLIELALTDTRDKVIARRVLFPEEYLLPDALAAGSFPARSDLDIRLRLETRSIEAAGYRLYLFYP